MEGINKRVVGSEYEMIAAVYLERSGVTIIRHNFRNRFGEIDLIGMDGEYLVFFEIKYRRDNHLMEPEEAVHLSKRRIISKMSDYYRAYEKINEFTPMRFDVVAICGEEIRWHKNAFDYCR